MGLKQLQQLAQGGSVTQGATAALCAELREARWAGPTDLLRAYPSAHIRGAAVEIMIDNDWSVALLVNYTTGSILIEAAISSVNQKLTRQGMPN